jgi:hypothetical protein
MGIPRGRSDEEEEEEEEEEEGAGGGCPAHAPAPRSKVPHLQDIDYILFSRHKRRRSNILQQDRKHVDSTAVRG